MVDTSMKEGPPFDNEVIEEREDKNQIVGGTHLSVVAGRSGHD